MPHVTDVGFDFAKSQRGLLLRSLEPTVFTFVGLDEKSKEAFDLSGFPLFLAMHTAVS